MDEMDLQNLLQSNLTIKLEPSYQWSMGERVPSIKVTLKYKDIMIDSDEIDVNDIMEQIGK